MNERRRRTGVPGWWGRYAGSVAFVTGLIFATVGFARIEGVHIGPLNVQGSIERIEAERTERTLATAGLIRLNCRTNNEQDRLLADLVKVSLGGGPFGEDVSTAELSTFDINVLTSIAKVQQLTQDNHLRRVFERKLRALRDLSPCGEIVANYIAGEAVPRTLEP